MDSRLWPGFCDIAWCLAYRRSWWKLLQEKMKDPEVKAVTYKSLIVIVEEDKERSKLLFEKGVEARGGGAVPFWRWRVCKAQKTPFFSIAVTHRPHIFYSCMSSHPKTHIFSFNLSLNAPWFEKLAFEKNTMYFTLVLVFHLCFKYHPKTLLFCELLALTRWPHIFLYFPLTECQKSYSHPMTPHFLSLCSHRMPQPVGGRALHPYPLHIWLPLPPPPV